MNADHLIYDAKQAALALYEAGYKAPIRKKIPVVGETGYAALLLGAEAMHLSGYISEHDLKNCEETCICHCRRKSAIWNRSR